MKAHKQVHGVEALPVQKKGQSEEDQAERKLYHQMYYYRQRYRRTVGESSDNHQLLSEDELRLLMLLKNALAR